MNTMQAEKVYKALANRRRLVILLYLQKHGQASVTKLSEHLRISFRSTSKHLQILRQMDIVGSEQIRLEQYYSLIKPLHPFVQQALEHVSPT